MKDRYIEVISADNGRDKIGILLNQKTQIVVPYYYLDVQKKKISELSMSEKDKIKKIIYAWKKYQKHYKDLNYGISDGVDNFYDFDLALDIVQDFIKNGLYVEFENQKTVRRCGKMEFTDTIKRCNPLLTQDGAVYLEYYTKTKKMVDQNLLKNLQIQVLNEIADTIGFAIGFKVHLEQESRITQFNKATTSQLMQLRNMSFNSRKLQLISYLIKYIEINLSANQISNRYVVTTAYHFWEAMVSETIGNASRNKLKKIYYVRHAYFNKSSGRKITESKPLMPDAVLEEGKNILVLDAKYYTGDRLPDNYDITKQFAYMDKAYGYYSKIGDHQFRNIMILPTDQKTRSSELQIVFDENVASEGSKTPIEIYYVNFTEMLEAYLSGKKIQLE